MAPKARMDIALRYDALSHQALLWVDSYGKAKVIDEMPLPYVENVLSILEREDLANERHPLVIALNARANALSEMDDEDESDEDDFDGSDEGMKQISGDELLDHLRESGAPAVVCGLVKALDQAGILSAYETTSTR